MKNFSLEKQSEINFNHTDELTSGLRGAKTQEE